jgi:hypothetical protein
MVLEQGQAGSVAPVLDPFQYASDTHQVLWLQYTAKVQTFQEAELLSNLMSLLLKDETLLKFDLLDKGIPTHYHFKSVCQG